jgi:hypothetical protein
MTTYTRAVANFLASFVGAGRAGRSDGADYLLLKYLAHLRGEAGFSSHSNLTTEIKDGRQQHDDRSTAQNDRIAERNPIRITAIRKIVKCRRKETQTT